MATGILQLACCTPRYSRTMLSNESAFSAMLATFLRITGDKTSRCSDFSTSVRDFRERRPIGVIGVRPAESALDRFKGIVFDCGVTGTFFKKQSRKKT